jgi:hypothetical protein
MIRSAGSGCPLALPPPGPADERRHEPPSPLPAGWHEQWSFWFHTGDGAMGGWASLSLHPGDAVARYHAGLVRAGEMVVAVSDDAVRLPRAPGLEIRSHGLWADHICETPLDHWTVTNETHALGVTDAEVLAGPDPRGDVVPLAIDLEWEDADEPAPLSGDGFEGYQVSCAVSGEVLVGRDQHDVTAGGGRDHRWGVGTARPAGARGSSVGAGGDGPGLLTLGASEADALPGLVRGVPFEVAGLLLEPVGVVPDPGGLGPGPGWRGLFRVLGPGARAGSVWMEWWPAPGA